MQKGVAPKSEVAIVFSGPIQYDDAHIAGARTMTLLLQSRLFDTIRQELGGTYSITATPDMDKYPRPEYSVRIDWTCDPARTKALVQRVFDEIEVHQEHAAVTGPDGAGSRGLLREFERNSQDNGYLLDQISRRYEDGDGGERRGRRAICRTESRR